MSEKSQKTQKKNWFKGLNAEFKKIIWPDKQTLVKETAAVVSVSVVLGAIIALVDFLAQMFWAAKSCLSDSNKKGALNYG